MPVVALVALVLAADASMLVKNRRIEHNQTVAAALYAAGLDDATVNSVHGALEAAEFNLRRARPGDQLRLVFRNGQLDVLDYRRNLMTEWQVRRDGDRYIGRKRELEREQRAEYVELNVETTLWDAAKAAGENTDIAITLSDVFAWDVDFYRDVQKGDRMRAIVEKVVHKGKTLQYGRVLAAEYAGSTVGTKRSFRYALPDGTETYFTEEGLSARKTFLKSPLKYAHVNSGFGSRFHPVLNYVGNHNGVDYQASVGTPVWAVSDGTVTKAGWDHGGGNIFCVKHVMSFETCYMHLSKILVKAGQRVAPKLVIAESGNTGAWATGPHLHFGLKRGGKWTNPLSQNFPRAEPLPKELLSDFKEKISNFAAQLSAHSVAVK